MPIVRNITSNKAVNNKIQSFLNNTPGKLKKIGYQLNPGNFNIEAHMAEQGAREASKVKIQGLARNGASTEDLKFVANRTKNLKDNVDALAGKVSLGDIYGAAREASTKARTGLADAKASGFADHIDAAKFTADAYFKGGSDAENRVRRATAGAVALGAYGAGAYGIRRASGGSLTRNADGERDVAGIPFV